MTFHQLRRVTALLCVSVFVYVTCWSGARRRVSGWAGKVWKASFFRTHTTNFHYLQTDHGHWGLHRATTRQHALHQKTDQLSAREKNVKARKGVLSTVASVLSLVK
jgi:hypothetical protein